MSLPVPPATLGLFVLTALAIVISPGPDTLIILRATLRAGRSAGLVSVLGVQAGLFVHTLLAVLGVSVLIASSPILFKTLAVAGALYLMGLGVQSFRHGAVIHLDGAGVPLKAHHAFRDALLCNLLNPKVILLFLALFPNFIDLRRGDTGAQLITLAVTLVAINVLWQTPIAFMGEIVRRWLKNPKILLAFNRLTGTILIGFAALLIIDHVL
ncbi:LysE family translocator [Varunaivibrio sulfuroxidans]|uniref:Threonine/homoserine/homoserine lactone efflux protein n=1 Tax=Varunaivibrio sulfuroxidans TaxID=1773489 RepID=A0A4R3J514_9PROT|nr:LysE family translocator [Varunaivibrio sulfuroxidans]TCS60969.1 threonine/homoserine/homoserine lactone efflux protein [Varunaivibrio sulfuroxidans]WES31624.1 LysE family translocator [Varunaivibrio sulfuroxidans]